MIHTKETSESTAYFQTAATKAHTHTHPSRFNVHLLPLEYIPSQLLPLYTSIIARGE